MADIEPFTLIEESRGGERHQFFDDVLESEAAKTADHDLHYISGLRQANPGMIVTGIPAMNVPLVAFAAAGHARCELDKETDSFASWRGYRPPALRQNKGTLAESVFFAKYHYQWSHEDFILYVVGQVQYVLKERRDSEHALGPSKATDQLIQSVGDWLLSDQEVVWVYDRYWMQSKSLWKQVQKANWDKVILDEGMKTELAKAANNFFSSRDVYEDLGVPWKRGLLFYGPPGNGKTISIVALMHTLLGRKHPIPTLYVKSAPTTFDIRNVFNQARALAPCMLVLEDIETIVTAQTRSYFFNEVDGLENNDGLFMIASTNFIERLDPGLSKRPSRFDRKYLFPLPNGHERTLYCEFWRRKLQKKPTIDFPEKLCPAMAHVTNGFSFAFLQECFVATLLILAREETNDFPWTQDSDLEDYELWRVFKHQADMLRNELSGQHDGAQRMAVCGHDDLTGPAFPSAASTSDPHGECHGNQRERMHLPDLQRLRIEDNTALPLLRHRKYARINTAAYMKV